MRNPYKPGNVLASARARFGLTQKQMATQLGISCSMVKLIETNRRILSGDALVKLAALEIRVAAMPPTVKTMLPGCVKELLDEDKKAYARHIQDHEADFNYKIIRLERQLAKMQAAHDEIISCLRNIEPVLKQQEAAGLPHIAGLCYQRQKLLLKLSRCSPQQQAILKNRIAMLYAEVSLNKSIHPRYVHTNEKPTIIFSPLKPNNYGLHSRTDHEPGRLPGDDRHGQ